jgi:hypothetical protein
MIQVDAEADRILRQLAPTEGVDKANRAVLKYLRSEPSVLAAGVSDGSESIWIKRKAGAESGVSYHPPGCG